MTTETHLLLTLGHNSSAIAVQGNSDAGFKIICGYEEERLTKQKSDSRMPVNSIHHCLQVAGTDVVEGIHVSHWAVDGQLNSLSKKHWDPTMLPDHRRLVSLSTEFTHHDCHANTAMWYAFAKPGLTRGNTMVLVVDGFGNFGEHMSLYQCGEGGDTRLIRRFFGYGGSMGLMYQYMTAYLGMKQHEDEYKILGYEAHIHTVDVDMVRLHELINKEIIRYLDGYFDSRRMFDPFDEMIKLDALPALQKHYIDRWNKIANDLDLQFSDDTHKRIVLGYFVQAVLEGVIATIVKIYKPHNLIATGGVFYNVKLGRKMLDMVPGKLCICPLAGDQGNAIGLFKEQNHLEWPGHLNWGVRPQASSNMVPGKNLFYMEDKDKARQVAGEILERNGYVNIVRGAMEFGPRAMCQTSTLAVPTPGIVNRINKVNGRNTIMPMAPVMNRTTYQARMQLTHKVHHSEEHMIVCLPYKEDSYKDILGAAHQYQDEATGRPQVLDGDRLMDYLLGSFAVLINTSFNVHGRPIVYDYEDALKCTEYQLKTEPVVTIYIGEQQ